MPEGVFEKRGVGNTPEVLVLQVAGPETIDSPNLSNPKIKEFCQAFGVSTEILQKLLGNQPNLDEFQPQGPDQFPVIGEDGRKEEDITLYLVNLPKVGITEVSLNILHQGAIKPSDNTSLHLKTKSGEEAGDFEILYGLTGSFTLTFPESAEPVAPGVYATSAQRKSIEVNPGTLVFIKAPNPNGWTAVSKEQCRFEYICNPPWHNENIRKALD